MQGEWHKSGDFIYSPGSIAVGLICGTLTALLGVWCLTLNIHSDDNFMTFGSLVLLALGVFCIGTETHRFRKRSE